MHVGRAQVHERVSLTVCRGHHGLTSAHYTGLQRQPRSLLRLRLHVCLCSQHDPAMGCCSAHALHLLVGGLAPTCSCAASSCRARQALVRCTPASSACTPLACLAVAWDQDEGERQGRDGV
jgi:hypothetical protein